MDSVSLGTSAVIAAALVPVVSLIKRDSWSHRSKYALGLAAAFVAAVLGAVIDGEIGNWREGLAHLGASLAVAQTVYNVYFKESALNERLTEVGN